MPCYGGHGVPLLPGSMFCSASGLESTAWDSILGKVKPPVSWAQPSAPAEPDALTAVGSFHRGRPPFAFGHSWCWLRGTCVCMAWLACHDLRACVLASRSCSLCGCRMLPTVSPHLLGSEHVRHVSRAAVLRQAEVEADPAAAERAPRLWQHRGLPARRCFKYTVVAKW